MDPLAGYSKSRKILKPATDGYLLSTACGCNHILAMAFLSIWQCAGSPAKNRALYLPSRLAGSWLESGNLREDAAESQ